MWIFGYGSLVWRPDFQYTSRHEGHIKGVIRRFWQSSVDHRGTLSNPGRVVTLVSTGNSSDCVYGVAYEVSKEHEIGVRQALDEREKDGYTVVETIFYPNDATNPEQLCYTYIADSSNAFWAGEAPLEVIAEQISHAHGPSGSNREYLFKLADAIRSITLVEDEHLFSLEKLVRRLVNEES